MLAIRRRQKPSSKAWRSFTYLFLLTFYAVQSSSLPTPFWGTCTGKPSLRSRSAGSISPGERPCRVLPLATSANVRSRTLLCFGVHEKQFVYERWVKTGSLKLLCFNTNVLLLLLLLLLNRWGTPIKTKPQRRVQQLALEQKGFQMFLFLRDDFLSCRRNVHSVRSARMFIVGMVPEHS